MCGIAGYVQRRGGGSVIGPMAARLAHRGPDGQGVWERADLDWTVALGHRRLSIIDIEGGRQPIGNEDGKVWLTYNGEIYNFRELRADLERRGHRFATRCDTEVIVHHYEEHGERELARLNGMFAFGLWDQDARRLLLARDRAGIKPLYYAGLPDGGVAFASELTALLAHPQLSAELDPDGLALYFFADYAQAPATLVRGVRKLRPGHFVAWTANGLEEPRPYWKLTPSSFPRGSPHPTGVPELLRSELNEAVRSQLVADVPVGVFLSGGVDSSLVAALAQRNLGAPVKTFSIGFDDPDFDESVYARKVAAAIGSEHIEQRFGEAALLDTLESALACLDEPVADPSLIPTYLLSGLAARHVKVALGGDGGDELWAGYPTYKAHRVARLFQMVPRGLRKRLVEPLVSRLPVRHGYQSFEWKLKRFVRRWDERPTLRHLRWMSNTDVPELDRLLPGFRQLPQAVGALLSEPTTGDFINHILALDFATYLPGSVLAKVDRAGMAHGLEVRPPLLDNRLVDLAFSLPSSMKMWGTKTKVLLKAAAAPLLPSEVIHRRKRGFAIPLARWINGPLRDTFEELMAGSRLWETGLLSRPAFADFLREHRQMRADRSKPLWALLVLDRWFARLHGAK